MVQDAVADREIYVLLDDKMKKLYYSGNNIHDAFFDSRTNAAVFATGTNANLEIKMPKIHKHGEELFILKNSEEIIPESIRLDDCFYHVVLELQEPARLEIVLAYWPEQPTEITDNCETFIAPPLKQTTLGIPDNQIQCKADLILIQRYDQTPACVTFQAREALIHRGWATGESSSFQEIIEQLRQGPQDVNSEHAELIKSLVVLDPMVSEFLKDTTWDYSCCGYLSAGKDSQDYKLVINFFDRDNKKQLAVSFDLVTLQVEKREIGNIVKLESGEN